MPAIHRFSGCVTAVANTSSPQVFDGQPWTADRSPQSQDACRAEDKRTGRVEQMLVDSEKHHDWVAEFEVDLGGSREAAQPVLRLVRVGSLS
jgi:hypothetical protein